MLAQPTVANVEPAQTANTKQANLTLAAKSVQLASMRSGVASSGSKLDTT
jgi:hypothetical protein